MSIVTCQGRPTPVQYYNIISFYYTYSIIKDTMLTITSTSFVGLTGIPYTKLESVISLISHQWKIVGSFSWIPLDIHPLSQSQYMPFCTPWLHLSFSSDSTYWDLNLIHTIRMHTMSLSRCASKLGKYSVCDGSTATGITMSNSSSMKVFSPKGSLWQVFDSQS